MNGEDPKRKLVTSLIGHYEPDAVVDDSYYNGLSQKYPDTDTLISKLISHYEPDAEVTTEYLGGLYSKYGVEKKNPSDSPSQNGLPKSQDGITVPSGGIEVPPKPLAGLGGVEVPKKGQEWKPTSLNPDEESSYRDFMTNDPNVVAWAEEFKNNYGEVPDIEGGEYDYRGAWKSGQTPIPVETENGTEYHWGSIGEMGKELKSPDHPTRWKSDYMQTFGKDPDEDGVSEPVGRFMVGLKSGMSRVMARVDVVQSEIDSGQFVIDGRPVSRHDVKKNLINRSFIQGLKNGTRSMQLGPESDPFIQEFANRQIEANGEYDTWKALKAGLLSAEGSIRNAPVWMNDLLEEATGIPNVLFTTFGSIGPEARKMAKSGEMNDRIRMSAEKVMEAANRERESMFKIDDPKKGVSSDMIDLYRQSRYGEMANMAINTTLESGPVMAVAAGASLVTGNPATGAAFLVPMMASRNYAETGMNNKEFRELAEKKGITDKEGVENFIRSTRLAKANMSGVFEGIPEAMMGPIIGRSFKVFSAGARQIVKQVGGELGEEAAKKTADEIGQQTARKLMTNYLGANALGGLEELTTTVGNEITDVVLGTSNKGFSEIMRSGLNDGLTGLMSTTLITTPGTGTALTAKGLQSTKRFYDNALAIDPSVISDFNAFVDTKVERRQMSKDQAETAKDNLAKREKAVKAVPEEKVSDTETIDLIERKQELEQKKKGLDPVYQEAVQEDIDKIDEKLRSGIEKPATEPVAQTQKESVKADAKPITEEEIAEAERQIGSFGEKGDADMVDYNRKRKQQLLSDPKSYWEQRVAYTEKGLKEFPDSNYYKEQLARAKQGLAEAMQSNKQPQAETAKQPETEVVSESELNETDRKAELEKRLGIKLPVKNTSVPVSSKTWGDIKSLANQISSELKGVVERGVSIQEWLDKGYGRQLSTWADEAIIEFLEVVEQSLKEQPKQQPQAETATEPVAEVVSESELNKQPTTETVDRDAVEKTKKDKKLTLKAWQWADLSRSNYPNSKHLYNDAKDVQDVKKSIEKDGYIEFPDGNENQARGRINEKGEITITEGNHRMVAMSLIDPNQEITLPMEFVEGVISEKNSAGTFKIPVTKLSSLSERGVSNAPIEESQPKQQPQAETAKKPGTEVVSESELNKTERESPSIPDQLPGTKVTEDGQYDMDDPYTYQELKGEPLIRRSKEENGVSAWDDNSNLVRLRIENAGDILRELSLRGTSADRNYLYEKINNLRDYFTKLKGRDLHQDDRPFGAMNRNEDLFRALRRAWYNQPTSSDAEAAVRRLVLELADGNSDGASLNRALDNVVAEIEKAIPTRQESTPTEGKKPKQQPQAEPAKKDGKKPAEKAPAAPVQETVGEVAPEQKPKKPSLSERAANALKGAQSESVEGDLVQKAAMWNRMGKRQRKSPFGVGLMADMQNISRKNGYGIRPGKTGTMTIIGPDGKEVRIKSRYRTAEEKAERIKQRKADKNYKFNVLNNKPISVDHYIAMALADGKRLNGAQVHGLLGEKGDIPSWMWTDKGGGVSIDPQDITYAIRDAGFGMDQESEVSAESVEDAIKSYASKDGKELAFEYAEKIYNDQQDGPVDPNAPQTEEEAREMEEYTARNRALLSEDPSMYAGLAAIDQLTEEQAEILEDEILAQEKYESSTKFIKDAERYTQAAATTEGVGQAEAQNDVPRNDSEREAEIAKRLRDKKIGGVSFVDPLFGAIGISKTLYDGALELAARQVEKGTAIGKAIANAIKYIDERMAGKKWDKGLFGRHLNDQFKMTVNGKEVEVKRDLSEETLEVVNGWYSPLEKTIKDTKADSLTAKEWLDRVRSKEGEDLWTGLRGMLEEKNPKDRVSKRELLNYLKDNRVDIVEVVRGDQSPEAIEAKRRLDEFDDETAAIDDKLFLLQRDYDRTGDINFLKEKNRLSEESLSRVGKRAKILGEYSALDQLSDNRATKFKTFQLEGEKSNYKEVLVTLPISSKGSRGWQDYRDEMVQKGLTLKEADETRRFLLGAPKESIDMPSVERARQKMGQKFFDNYQDVLLDKKSRSVKENQFKSSHYDEPNILVHLRMNTRTDAQGNKVLFLEEVQSDWGQKGKKEGFSTDGNKKYDVFLRRGGISKSGVVARSKEEAILLTAKEKVGEDVLSSLGLSDSEIISGYEAIELGGNIPSAPFVTDTNSWVKLAFKVALKEAVAQGVDRIAWATGTQQFERWGSEKIDWKKTGDGWVVSVEEQTNAAAFDGVNISEKAMSEKGAPISSKRDLKGLIERTLKRERNDEEINKLTDRIWKRMQTEDNGTSLPRKEGMEAFYGSPKDGSKGILGGVTEALTGQKVGTVEIETKEGRARIGGDRVFFSVDGVSITDPTVDIEYGENIQGDKVKYWVEQGVDENVVKNALNEAKGNDVISTQHSIDITPEMKSAVEKGLPLFGTSNAELAKSIRDKKITGVMLMDPLFGAIGITKAVYNGAIELAARLVENDTEAGKIIAAVVEYVKKAMKGNPKLNEAAVKAAFEAKLWLVNDPELFADFKEYAEDYRNTLDGKKPSIAGLTRYLQENVDENWGKNKDSMSQTSDVFVAVFGQDKPSATRPDAQSIKEARAEERQKASEKQSTEKEKVKAINKVIKDSAKEYFKDGSESVDDFTASVMKSLGKSADGMTAKARATAREMGTAAKNRVMARNLSKEVKGLREKVESMKANETQTKEAVTEAVSKMREAVRSGKLPLTNMQVSKVMGMMAGITPKNAQSRLAQAAKYLSDIEQTLRKKDLESRKKDVARKLSPEAYQYSNQDRKRGKAKVSGQAQEQLAALAREFKDSLPYMDEAALTALEQVIDDIFADGALEQKDLQAARKEVRRSKADALLVHMADKTGAIIPLFGGKDAAITALSRPELGKEGRGNTIVLSDGVVLHPTQKDLEFAKTLDESMFEGAQIILLMPKSAVFNPAQAIQAKLNRLKGGVFSGQRVDVITAVTLLMGEETSQQAWLDNVVNPILNASFFKHRDTAMLHDRFMAMREEVFGKGALGRSQSKANAYLKKPSGVRFTDTDGRVISESLTNEQVTYIYMAMLDPRNIEKMVKAKMPLALLMEIADKVNGDPKIKDYANGIIGIYESYLPKVNEALSTHGYQVIIPHYSTDFKKGLVEDTGDALQRKLEPMRESLKDLKEQLSLADPSEVDAIDKKIAKVEEKIAKAEEAEKTLLMKKDIYERLYGSVENMPDRTPYAPASVSEVTEGVDSAPDIQKMFSTNREEFAPSVLSDNMIEKKGGGEFNPIVNAERMFSRYAESMSNAVNKMSLYENLYVLMNDGSELMKMIEKQYGPKYAKRLRALLENVVMERNAQPKQNNFPWIDRSMGVAMALNWRSAAFQVLSAPNYWIQATIDENIGPEYFMKVTEMFNKEGRGNLREDLKEIVEEGWFKERVSKTFIPELKDLASDRNGKVSDKWIDDVLQVGFKPNKFVDSNVTIALFGMPLYSAMKDKYFKEYSKTMNEADAREKAKETAQLKFFKYANSTQQTALQPWRSLEQNDGLLRMFQGFQNTNMLYTREQLRKVADIANNRGSLMKNLATIMYYQGVQQATFAVLQQGIMWSYMGVAALLKGSDDEEDKKAALRQSAQVTNQVANSFLRGLGVYGTAVAVVKDIGIDLFLEYAPRDRHDDVRKWYDTIMEHAPRKKGKTKLALDAIGNIAPSMSIKTNQFLRLQDRLDKEMRDGDKLNAYDRYALPMMVGTEFVFNIPTSSATRMIDAIQDVTEDDMAAGEAFLRLTSILPNHIHEANKRDLIERTSTEIALSKSKKELEGEMKSYKENLLKGFDKGEYVTQKVAETIVPPIEVNVYALEFGERYKDAFGQDEDIPKLSVTAMRKEHNLNTLRDRLDDSTASIFIKKDGEGKSLHSPMDAASRFADSKKESLSKEQMGEISDYLFIEGNLKYLENFESELQIIRSRKTPK